MGREYAVRSTGVPFRLPCTTYLNTCAPFGSPTAWVQPVKTTEVTSPGITAGLPAMLHGSVLGGQDTVAGQWPAYERSDAFGGGVNVNENSG
jgi:hypothetical protein